METASVFDEWTTYATKKALRPRDFDFSSVIHNSKTKIVAITGIRRSGKSSILMLLLQQLSKNGRKTGYVNVEDSRIKDEAAVLDETLKWFGDDGYLFLDEVTSAKDWQGWLARNHELLKGKLHLIVSSSRKNLITPQKPLRGRMLSFELYPLSFKEFLAFRDIQLEKTTAGRGKIEKAFDEYLKFGGFPEVALTSNQTDKIRLLNAYFKDIVGLDVAEASGQDLTTIELFGKYVTQTTYFSASKCLNFLKSLGHKIGKEKILELEQYAQESYLFFFNPIFSYNIKDKAQYPRKAYAGDLGFYYATTGKTDFGRLYENAAFLELKRRTQGQKEIGYWKNPQGLQVDFVVKQGTNVSEIIQVVYDLDDEKTKKRETNALVACAKELKPAKTTILTKNLKQTKTIDDFKIQFIPLMDWLLA